MRLDNILHKRSTMSVPKGYLQMYPDKSVSFTKYKNQLEGRMHILVWVIYNIALQFMKDKELFHLQKEDIKSVSYNEKKVGMSFGGKYGELLIKANSGTVYEFYIDPSYDQGEVHAFVKSVQG